MQTARILCCPALFSRIRVSPSGLSSYLPENKRPKSTKPADWMRQRAGSKASAGLLSVGTSADAQGKATRLRSRVAQRRRDGCVNHSGSSG